ncbi:glycosyltransferase family 9 protein [Paraglaciecola sp. 2405UD69-4]|uniref:glycosyltransferase family 9 protein n=1 Tax=Paraglaciecola sp. 2405UD69-4 TaxID=3391836 RepID=UPI0039C954E2
MTEILDNTQPAEKILVIRMLSTADICAIGLPVVRYFKQQNPNAELHFLTFGDGVKLMKLAEPEVKVYGLTKAQWPDDFFQGLEAFLALAEEIVGEAYSQIINLDTSFMPCFLARFLKDALEPVSGNFLSLSVKELLTQVQNQTLEADYVNSPQRFTDSTFSLMYKWHSQWWKYEDAPDGGYPEFYLKKCCGLVVDKLQSEIIVTPDKRLSKNQKKTKVIGLCFEQSADSYVYPYQGELKKSLEQLGYVVWVEQDCKGDLKQLLKMLTASDLMVCKSAAVRWYAQAVECPTLLVSGASEPSLLMPEFATDTVSPCLRHSAGSNTLGQTNARACNCDNAADLTESIESIFEHLAEEAQGVHNG